MVVVPFEHPGSPIVELCYQPIASKSGEPMSTVAIARNPGISDALIRASAAEKKFVLTAHNECQFASFRNTWL
jgi:hypothetical protein